jgi:hypothetical protein
VKFYVQSGKHQEIIAAPDATEAALNFIERVCEKYPSPKLGGFIQISEVGFDDDGPGHENDLWYSTEAAIDQLGDV